jgi:hypothetical protein
MITPELQTYIRQQLGAGVAKDVIIQTLSAKGWSEQDINSTFAIIENPQPAPAAVTPSPAAKPLAQNPMQNPVQSPVKTFDINSINVNSSGRKGMWAIVIVILLLVCAGGAFAAYYYGLFAPLISTFSTPAESPVTTPVASSTPTTTENASTTPMSATTTSTSTAMSAQGNQNKDFSYLEIVSSGNVDLLVTDPAGKKTGIDPSSGAVLQNIPNSGYFFDSLNTVGDNGSSTPDSATASHSVEISQPQKGTFFLVVDGDSSGAYDISINGSSTGGVAKQAISLQGNAKLGSVVNYQITYSPDDAASTTVSKITTK